jgi:hypothetical protein
MSFAPIDLRTNLQLASLGDVNRPWVVHDISGNYQNLYLVLAILSQMEDPEFLIQDGSPEIPFSRGYNATDRKFVNAYLDDVTISNTVAARVLLPNGNLVITLANPDNVGFRVGDVVMAGVDFRRKGQVVNVTLPTIEIRPTEGLAAFAAADFALGEFFAVHYDSSALVESPGKTSLTVTPRTDYNVVSTIRDSHRWSMRNTNVASLVDNKNTPEGLWQNAQITMLTRRVLQQVDRMLLGSQRAQNIQGPNGLEDSNGGLDWSLRNRGGNVVDLNNAMTRLQFETWLRDTMQAKTGGHRRRPWLVMGRAAYQRINSFGTGDYIRYQRDLFPGMRGNVMGANFGVFQVAGYEFNLCVLEALANRNLFPQQSTIAGVSGTIRDNDIYLIDADPIPTDNAFGERPAVQMLHWSPDGSETGGSPWYYGMVRGMNAAQVSVDDIKAASANPIVTDIEASSLHVMYIGGMDMITGKFSGKMGYLQ